MSKRFLCDSWVVMAVLLMTVGCDEQAGLESQRSLESQSGETAMSIHVTSPAFEDGGMIPATHTCDGENISPALQWDGVPDQAQSLVLIADDPDAPNGTWVHWVMWNIPADRNGLSEALPGDPMLEGGLRQGVTDFQTTGYGGPCPPSGVHRYYFKVYALNSMLAVSDSATKTTVMESMKGHVIAQGQLVGRYQRQ